MSAHRPRLLAAILFPVLLGPAAARAQEDPAPLVRARAVERDLVETLGRVEGATVGVVSKERSRGLRTPGGAPVLVLEGVGSGVLVRFDGRVRVVTCAHVVDAEGTIEVVTADGVHHPARVEARDDSIDLAVLSFAGPAPRTGAVEVEGRPPPDLREGTWVVATGSPFFLGLDGRDAASLGVVSGLRPAHVDGYVRVPLLQHDAEINPGSSGGPLWNLKGDLIAINGTIATRSRSQGGGPAHTGASFAIPVAEVRRFLRTSLGGGAPGALPQSPPPSPGLPAPAVRPVERGLGLRSATRQDARGRALGAVVTSVDPRSPAGGPGGIQPGDLVTLVRTTGRAYAVRTSQDLDRALALFAPGTRVGIRFVRRGRTYEWWGPLAGG